MAGTGETAWVIDARGIVRRFGTQTALAGIDLQVAPGEIFGVLGPDGAGKTTFMQILAAILDPTEGRCRVLGRDTVTQSSEITAHIGYMSQGFTLYDRLTVDENLEFAAGIRGLGGRAFAQRRQRLLAMAGLEPYRRRPAGKLSGGMRKKLSLCANLIHAPPLLLLDELSLGVDPVSRRELWRMLRGFREAGATIVVTTPYMDEADYCDRLALLDQGRMLALGAPDALRAKLAGQVYELETADERAALAILAEFQGLCGLRWSAGRLRLLVDPRVVDRKRFFSALGELGSLSLARATLEDVFVQLTTRESADPVPDILIPDAAHPETQDTVQLRNVTCRFGTFTAVDDVSLTVREGEVFGFLGPNGAGKTTLIRVMCALLRPASGTVRVAGVDVLKAPERVRGRIGYMSQRFSLYLDLTVGENLRFFAGVYGLAGDERDRAIGWACRMVRLGGMEGRKVGEISAALRQRLALACSILHRPAVLFLDEPTSGIDPVSRQRFWALIRALASGGMSVFVTTHYLEEASYCHRLGLMYDGRLIALGSIAALQERLSLPKGVTMEEIFMAYIERENASRRSRVPVP